MTARGALRVSSCTALLLVLCAWQAGAQQRPLRKTDLVRLLTSPALSKAQVAQRIRSQCLAFDPTSRDRMDLVDLGADAGVIAAVDECVRRTAAAARLERGAPRPAPRRAAPPRQAAPARPVLGPPAMAAVEPGEVTVRAGEPARRVPVTVTLRDARGNPVPGEEVRFVPLTDGLGVSAFAGRTNGAGVVSAVFATNLLKRDGEIGIFVRGTRLALLRISVPPVVLSGARTGFVAGADQRGAAGQALGAALVFEVRDTTGAPVAGQTVGFAATNAAVSPAAGTTDENGRIAVRVTLGKQAGQAGITASIADIRKDVAFPVAPGPAATLIVQRDSARVAGTLSFSSSRPAYLLVRAQDAYGNDVPVAGLTAGARDPGVLDVQRVSTSGMAARVQVRPRASGTSELDLAVGAARQRLPVEVLLPVAAGGWLADVRVGYGLFSYTYRSDWAGHGGPVAEVALGRTVIPGLSVALAGTFAAVQVDTGVVRSASGVSLLDASLRLEYAFMPQAQASPVLLAGGGSYQTTSSTLGNAVWHVSYFWLGGAGADFKVRPGTTGEVRLVAQRLEELNSTTYNAPVGWLVALTAGARFTF